MDLTEYTQAVWAQYTEHAPDDERKAQADVLRAARDLVERVYTMTDAGFAVEDPLAEVVDVLDGVITLLDPDGEAEDAETT